MVVPVAEKVIHDNVALGVVCEVLVSGLAFRWILRNPASLAALMAANQYSSSPVSNAGLGLSPRVSHPT